MNTDTNPAETPVPQLVTVKQLREALAKLPAELDDQPLVVRVPLGDDAYETFGVTDGPEHEVADWKDGRGMVADTRYVALTAFASFRALRSGLEIELLEGI